MATTIQISEPLQEQLQKRKLSDRETYEEIIWDMIEDTQELNEETKRELVQARAEIKAGKFKTLSAVKKELGI
jgi:predicted kinase